jgi:PUA-domain protein
MIKTLSKSEIRELEDQFVLSYGKAIVNKKDLVQIVDNKMVLVNKEPFFFLHEGKYVPTLKLLLKDNILRKITVDMGAVKFVIGGADIMRPGIVDVENNIKAGDFISVVDVNNKKPLAVGIALFSSQEIRDYKTGRVVKNIHWVGDELWKTQ